MQDATAAASFDVQSWYDDHKDQFESGHKAATDLMALLQKSMVHTRCFFHPEHEKAKRTNRSDNVIKGHHAVTSQKWLPTLEIHNENGRRVYFVVNDGGNTWDEVASKPGNCRNHFCEFDAKHGFTVADAISTDWTTIGGVGFIKPAGGIYTGSFSPQLYFPVEPYENHYRWFINQCRLVQVLGADPACTDLSRVMRLPPFHNTYADGSKGRQSLLLFCNPEDSSTIAEFEAALLKFEQACNMDPFDCIPRGKTVNDEHRAGLISGFVEIFGEEIREEFERFFPKNAKVRAAAGSWADFFDSRSIDEITAAMDLIPPFILGNSDNTFKGEAPVTLADKREVRIDYFRLMAGLKAAWIQRRLDPDQLVDFLAERWVDCDRGWIADTLNGANGSIESGSFWHFARLCGYRLTKPQEESPTQKGNGLSAVKEGESVVDAAKRDAASMEELYAALFELASRPIGKGTRNEMQAIKSRLSVYFGIRATDVDLRLIEMISDKHGFSLSVENEVEREELTFSAGDDHEVPELIPYLCNRGSDCVVIGKPGSGKTTLGATAGDRVVTGEPLSIAGGPIRQTGKTLYIATDGGEEAKTILESYCVKAGIDVARHKREGTWLIYAADRKRKQLSWAFCVRDLERLIRSLEAHKDTDKPIRLIVIDTLISVLEAGGINPGIGPVGACIRLMHEIASRYGATVMWLHHTTKDGALAAGHGDITRVTNSNHYLELHETLTDKNGRPVAVLSTDKHRGREKRKVHYVLDSEQGIAIAQFDDPAEKHADALIRELYREAPDAVSPTLLAENLCHLNLSRKLVRGALSTIRIDHGWTDSDNNGKWFLTAKGMKEVDRRMEEQQAELSQAQWEDSAAESQSSVAA